MLPYNSFVQGSSPTETLIVPADAAGSRLDQWLVAQMPEWIEMMINTEELDLGAPDSGRFRPAESASTKELLAAFDANVAKAANALQGTNEEHLMKPWSFKMGGHVASQNPRYIMIQESVINHWAHHRGQLTVFLRLNEAKVPAIYGPSADEKF